MRRVTSKSVIARDFVFKPKCTFRGRAPPETPLGSLSAPPGPLAAVGAMEGNTL